MNRAVSAVILTVSSLSAYAGEPIEGNMLPLPAPGGWAMTADGVTLIVSQPEIAELVYFDTVSEQETKRVEVDFKPAVMAVQGTTLYVAAKGASTVHVLDAVTGNAKKEIDLGGDAIARMACHPSKGMIYASTATHEVFAIDPATGIASRTKATGSFLAVDPVNASAVFTGVQPPLDWDRIIIEDLPGGAIRIYWDQWGARAFILKYSVQGRNLKLVSSQKNAAVNAFAMAITPDGKKVLMPSGGGWRPPAEGGTGGGYMCAAFSAANLATRVGEAPSATDIAFHPVLNLGVLNLHGREVQLVNPRTLVGGKIFTIAQNADARSLLITFGGKGTKIILWNGDNPANSSEGLHFLPLELTSGDRSALEKVYGKLPSTAVARSEITVQGKSSGTKTMPPASPAEEAAAALPDGIIAVAGFNDASGLNGNSRPGSPYPLGKNNTQGGFGERGWAGVWTGDSRAAFVRDRVAEGDGALHLTATTNYGRTLSKAQSGQFAMEAMVCSPEKGGFQCYIWEKSVETTGPMWGVRNGRFAARDGQGNGEGSYVPIADCRPNAWHKVTVTIDTANQKWSMAVDGQGGERQFGFRYRPTSLQGINFLVEGNEQIYLDAIRIMSVDQ